MCSLSEKQGHSMISTLEELENHKGALSIDNIDPKLFKLVEDPVQPPETDDIRALKSFFKDAIYEVLNKDKTIETDQGHINKCTSNLEFLYGGPIRFYHKFLIARKGNLKKACKMMKTMLEKRYALLGETLITNMINVDNVDKLESTDPEESKILTEIAKFWVIEYFGYTEDHHLLLTAKLKDVDLYEVSKKFTRQQFDTYFYYFVEKALLLQRFANSPSFTSKEVIFPNDEVNKDADSLNTKYRRNIEIYDWKRVTRKQVHIQGLKIVRDVLGSGAHVFPEHVEKTFMINTPWYFTMIWAVFSVILDKESKGKGVISKTDCTKQISSLLGVDSEDEKETQEAVDKIWIRVERHLQIANDLPQNKDLEQI